MNRTKYVIMALAVLIVWGCATKRIETSNDTATIVIRTDTLRDSVFHTDSVFVLDSVFLMAKNDTIYKERWRTEIKYKDRWRDRWHDVTSTDTITKITTETKYIEKKLTKWQTVQIWCGRLFLIIILGISAIISIRMIKF